MELELIPNKSLGKFKFGMSPKEIINILGKPKEIIIKDYLNSIIFGNLLDIYHGKGNKKRIEVDKLLTLITSLKQLNNKFSKETSISIWYKDISFSFDSEDNYKLSSILLDNKCEILLNNVNLFNLKKEQLISLLNSNYQFEYYNPKIENFINFINFDDFKYDKYIYACNLDFDSLGLMFHYDCKFEILEGITTGTNMFDEE